MTSTEMSTDDVVPDVRSLLEDSLTDIPNRPAVALSGGVDSTSLLFALLELDKSPRAYTFHVDGHESTDLQVARDICGKFTVPLTTVALPTDIQTIKEDTYNIIRGLGYTAKTDIECIWPFLYLLPEISESALVTGACADGHFVISREAMLNGKTETVERMDQFRAELFSDPDYAQAAMVERLAGQYEIEDVRVPYSDRPMVRAFLGTAWDDINKPTQKQPIIDAYPERFSRVRVRTHTNLQTGDSRIQDQFEQLVDSRWNTGGWKSPVGIYNAIDRGEVPPDPDPDPDPEP